MERLTVAVEAGLSPVVEALRRSGLNTCPIEACDLGAIDAIVVTGMDSNVMNKQDALTRAPVVSAEGCTPEQVVERILRQVR